jgi:pimeloyl-ACP methyl ester carboxylesterase
MTWALRNQSLTPGKQGFIWMGTSLPYPIQSDTNPTAPSLELWHYIINSMRTSRSEFVSASLPGIFGIPAGCVVPAKTLEHFERIVAQADGLAIERTCQIQLHRDFRPLVKRLGEQGEEGVKVLLIHGDSDKSMPYECSAGVVKEMVPRAEAKIYEKASHGMYLTHAEQVLQDILDFIGGVSGEQRN